ncbi:probable G-protein coupled receptor 132 isoform X1 [Meles meles]|uniref:probable G-protein coupled receptor 132 isoform X1 n=2 Tax=Meles meles TaxID=9662 RepID=UPI001E69E57D|nr:probable G-protein coupled receptor 132 isoform X1 [Meles meles]XP_045863226.1 probable G-protein coupled receptor 132 isoform X1 [Meles meles]XP_045863227.1 probable G-protein coupled receptor 132 isoform X1 [Meles meles]
MTGAREPPGATMIPEPSHTPGNASTATSPVPVTGLPGMGASSCNASFEDSRVFLVVVYSAVFAVGLPANCVTAGLTLLQVLQGNVLAVYLFSLALCELLYIGTLPLWAVYIQNQHRWTLGVWACRVTGYIFFCNLYVSILFLCCISCDRFLAVVYALESRGRRQQRTAVLVSASVFVLVGLAHSPVFRMGGEPTCFEAPMDTEVVAFYYLRFTLGFAVPLAVIAFTNRRVFRSVKQSAGLSDTQKTKVKRSVIAVVTIFLVCFAPYHLVLLTKAVAYSYYRGQLDVSRDFEVKLCQLSAVFLCLSTVNSVADPIIYVLATDCSRQEVSRIHRGWKKCSASADVPKHTCSKGSEELSLPTLPTNDSTFPRAIHPLESGPATWSSSLDTLERLDEESH